LKRFFFRAQFALEFVVHRVMHFASCDLSRVRE
jgi:hypothetical protein